MSIYLSGSVGESGQNVEADVRAVQQRLVDLGFTWVAVDGDVGPQTIRTIRLFQAITRGHQSVAGTGVDGRIDVNGFTHRWLNAANAPRWQKMLAGSADEGYVNSEVNDPNDDHDYGTNWFAEVITTAGAYYRDNYLADHTDAALIDINDMSKPEGGDTPDHAGHETGLSCDLRLPKSNGESGGITWQSTNYDRSAMRAMLQSFTQNLLVNKILFNDTTLIGESLCVPFTGHDNHAHVEIQAPELL